MGEAVQQRPGEPLGAEDFGPFIEGEVGGDQDGAALVALAEDLEEEFGRGFGQGHEAQFIHDEELVGGELPLEAQEAFFVAGFQKFGAE